jgi:DNA ligase-1
LLKLATGELGRHLARLAKQALAEAFGLDVERSRRSGTASAAVHRAVRLGRGRGRAADRARRAGVPPVHARPPARGSAVSLDDYAAEWKWDGIRVQLVHAGGETRLYSRTGDDISGSFPRHRRGVRRRRACSTASCWSRHRPGRGGAWRRGGELQRAPAAARAQERQAKMLGDYPAFVRLYDILFDGDEDLRRCRGASGARGSKPLPPKLDPERFDLSR